MIEEKLIEYGILGLWTITLLIERYTWRIHMRKSIDKLAEEIHNRKEKLEA